MVKVFLSWSGDRSRRVAELLHGWIPCVLQAAQPWFSPEDIDRGAMWFAEINDQLQDTSIGIICLTKSNKEKPWIMFESGALAKGLTSARLCTLLIDLKPGDVFNPLSQFNHTIPESQESMLSLVFALNKLLGDKMLSSERIKKSFDAFWPEFESSFNRIISETEGVAVDPMDAKPKEGVMHEILDAIRSVTERIDSLETRVVRQQRQAERRISNLNNKMSVWASDDGRHVTVMDKSGSVRQLKVLDIPRNDKSDGDESIDPFS